MRWRPKEFKPYYRWCKRFALWPTLLEDHTYVWLESFWDKRYVQERFLGIDWCYSVLNRSKEQGE
jgi:hypothetical protein